MQTINQNPALETAFGKSFTREKALQIIKENGETYSQFLEFPTEHHHIPY